MSQLEPSAFSQFVAEMRRRHLVRFAFGYLAAAFVVLQLAEIVFPAFGMGELALRILVIVVALGFLPSVVLAWIFDITGGGIKRTEGGAADGLIPRLALLVVTIGVVGGLTVFMAGTGVFEARTEDGSDAPFELAEYDPSVPIRSIAVLPLEDFSSDGSQRYFTAGMHEELIAKLSQLEELRAVDAHAQLERVRRSARNSGQLIHGSLRQQRRVGEHRSRTDRQRVIEDPGHLPVHEGLPAGEVVLLHTHARGGREVLSNLRSAEEPVTVVLR